MTKRVNDHDVVYRSSPRLAQRKFPERKTTVRQRPRGTAEDLVAKPGGGCVTDSRTPRVQFPTVAPETGERTAKSARRKGSAAVVAGAQQTLTQFPFLQRESSSLSSAPTSRKRKRESRRDDGRAQTTITQMPLVRSFNSRSDIEDHLGYESQGSSGGADLPGAVDSHPQSRAPVVSTRVQPVADSEDEGDGEEVTSAFETQICPRSNTMARRVSNRPSSPATTACRFPKKTNEQSSHAPDRTPRARRLFGIPSSQSPGSSPVTERTKRLNPKLTRSVKSISPGNSGLAGEADDAPDRRPNPRRTTRAPLQIMSASSVNVVMSPTKRRILAFQARMSTTIGRTSHGSHGYVNTEKRRLFVPSSTRTSAWSSIGGEENEQLSALDGQFDVGVETQAEMLRLSSNESLPGQPTQSSIASKQAIPRSQEIGSLVGAEPLQIPNIEREESLESNPLRSLSRNESMLQDHASAQLLAETQAGIVRCDRRLGDVGSSSQQDELPGSTLLVRSSQATTVDGSPVRQAQHMRSSNQAQDFLVPSSPASRHKGSRNHRAAKQVVPLGSDANMDVIASSPSLRRPSTIGLESSPMLSGKSQLNSGFVGVDLDDEVISATQYLGESVPPPPMWSED